MRTQTYRIMQHFSHFSEVLIFMVILIRYHFCATFICNSMSYRKMSVVRILSENLAGFTFYGD